MSNPEDEKIAAAPVLSNLSGGTYTFQDEILTEVVVDDEAPDDDDSTVWSDAGDNVEETLEEIPDTDAVEMAVCVFSAHSDSVYTVATHPTRPGVVLTGMILLVY